MYLLTFLITCMALIYMVVLLRLLFLILISQTRIDHGGECAKACTQAYCTGLQTYIKASLIHTTQSLPEQENATNASKGNYLQVIYLLSSGVRMSETDWTLRNWLNKILN